MLLCIIMLKNLDSWSESGGETASGADDDNEIQPATQNIESKAQGFKQMISYILTIKQWNQRDAETFHNSSSYYSGDHANGWIHVAYARPT